MLNGADDVRDGGRLVPKQEFHVNVADGPGKTFHHHEKSLCRVEARSLRRLKDRLVGGAIVVAVKLLPDSVDFPPRKPKILLPCVIRSGREVDRKLLAEPRRETRAGRGLPMLINDNTRSSERKAKRTSQTSSPANTASSSSTRRPGVISGAETIRSRCSFATTRSVSSDGSLKNPS